MEITFIDEQDRVRCFNHLEDELFKRPAKMLGRDVKDCHPPGKWETVKELLRVFKAGERDLVEFWFEKAGKPVYVRYQAVRDDAGEYIGCLEIAQRLDRIKSLTGEKRTID